MDHFDYFRHVLDPCNNFLVACCVVYRFLILLSIKDAVNLAKSSLWAPGGTGSRIFGDNIANKAVSRGSSSGAKTSQDKLANMQQKLQNKNLSNKKRKELKKQERKIRSDDKKRSQGPSSSQNNSHVDESELVLANVQALTI